MGSAEVKQIVAKWLKSWPGMLYIVHSSTLSCMVSVCVTTIDMQIHDDNIICDCAAVCNSAVSLLLGSHPPSFLLLAILQGDVDCIV